MSRTWWVDIFGEIPRETRAFKAAQKNLHVAWRDYVVAWQAYDVARRAYETARAANNAAREPLA